MAKRRRVVLEESEGSDNEPLVSDDDDDSQFERMTENGDISAEEADEDAQAVMLDILGDHRIRDEEEENGEDLMDTLEQDYKEMPELDRYDEELLDESDQKELSYEERLQAERMMDERDKGERDEYYDYEDEEDYLGEEEDGVYKAKDRRYRYLRPSPEYGVDSLDEDHLEVQDLLHESPANTVFDDIISNRIMKLFRKLLRTYYRQANGELAPIRQGAKNTKESLEQEDDSHAIESKRIPIGLELIRDAIVSNKQSILISYTLDLVPTLPGLSVWVIELPLKVVPLLTQVVQEESQELFPLIYNSDRTHQKLVCRIHGLPVIDKIRDLHHDYINILVQFHGIIVRKSSIYPSMKIVVRECFCGYLFPPIELSYNQQETPLGNCPECQKKGPFKIHKEKTLFENYQVLMIQELTNDVLPGRVPRNKEVICLGDIVDIGKTGDVVEVCGVLMQKNDIISNVRTGFPLFNTYVLASSLRKRHDTSLNDLTKEDVEEIKELSRDPNIIARIIKSIAPSIYGYDNIKTAIACSLFGGRRKITKGQHKLRGDVNVLVLGDPGTAKTQFLKYVEKVFYKCIYANGKGASAVGLTASVRKDNISNEWVLEGGALVRADQGVCLIDEFDKMSYNDRSSIHEAMEQQTISISKAGIVSTLSAQCSVIAVANPNNGVYDTSKTFQENVNLTEPILSRFDVLCVVKDQHDPIQDEMLAQFVISNHAHCHPAFEGSGEEKKNDEKSAEDNEEIEEEETSDIKPISQDLLKKYIYYARYKCYPKISKVNHDRIANFYTKLRQESMQTGGIKLTVRYIESIVRLCESFAKMRLSPQVVESDVDKAIAVMLSSFIASQKYSITQRLEKTFVKFLSMDNDIHSTILYLLVRLMKDNDTLHEGMQTEDRGEREKENMLSYITKQDLETVASHAGIQSNQLTQFYNSSKFRKSFSLKNNIITRTAAYHHIH